MACTSYNPPNTKQCNCCKTERDVQHPPGIEWNCNACTFKNKPNAICCAMCGQSIKSSILKPSFNNTSSSSFNKSQQSKSNPPLIIPYDLFDKFAQICANNRNEIVAYLCAYENEHSENDNNTITHMVLPSQNEYSLPFSNFIFQNHLKTVGTIHFHPSQALFLSSIEIHSLYSQPWISIVYAPKGKYNNSSIKNENNKLCYDNQHAQNLASKAQTKIIFEEFAIYRLKSLTTKLLKNCGILNQQRKIIRDYQPQNKLYTCTYKYVIMHDHHIKIQDFRDIQQ